MYFYLLSVILVLIFLAHVWEKRKTILLCWKLKSDIRSYPIVGHGYLFLGSQEDKMTAVHRLGREAIKHGGLSKVVFLHKMLVVVADPKLAELILRNILDKGDLMKLARNLTGNGSIFAPVWRPRRKLLNRTFCLKNLNEFVTTFDKNSRTMVEQLAVEADRGAFSVWKYLAAAAMDSICETVLDYPIEAFKNQNHPFLLAFYEYCETIVSRIFSPWLHNYAIYSSMPWHWKANTYIKFMHNFVDQIIKTKRMKQNTEVNKTPAGLQTNVNHLDNWRKTLLDLMLKPTSSTESFTDLEIREELLIILLAGSDTSAAGSGYVLLMLAMYQDVQNEVYEELLDIFGTSLRSVTHEDLHKMKYLDAVIRETLRLYPPVGVITRNTEKDTVLPCGLLLPKDTEVLLNIWAINRNPQYWGEDANRFDPRRFFRPLPHPAAWASFSFGPRNCLGYTYSMMSMKTTLSTLLRRYRVLPAQYAIPDTPLRVKYDVMVKDVYNYTIKLKPRVL